MAGSGLGSIRWGNLWVQFIDLKILTYCCLATSYGDKTCGPTLAQVMTCNQAITWINVDLSSVRLGGIHLMALSLEDLKIMISITRLKFEFLGSYPDFPGTSELKLVRYDTWEKFLSTNSTLMEQDISSFLSPPFSLAFPRLFQKHVWTLKSKSSQNFE